jgi:hypothetical protein
MIPFRGEWDLQAAEMILRVDGIIKCAPRQRG